MLFKQNKFEQVAEWIKNRNTIALDLVGDRIKTWWKSMEIFVGINQNIIDNKLGH